MQTFGFETIPFTVRVKVILYSIIEMQHGFLNFLKDLSRKGVVSEVQSSSKLILKKVYTYVEGTCL